MKRRYLLGLAFLSVLHGATAAEIYTCNVGGKTVYQGKPCAGSKELRDKVNNAKAQESSRQQAYERQKAE